MPRELREQSKYRVERLLGRGGMGSVFAAYHERMDRPVAIKVINSALVDHPEALNRFDQEVKAAAKLDHPNVARAYDADEFGSLRVLVMEYVPGQSLDRLLNARGRLTVVEACRLMRQAMIGLDHAHARGMVHRDLKPQNMMLTPTGKLKILDFGLAKIASEQRAGAGLTRDNALMGTPHYLAPEQALDAARADIRADIYSLGCTLYCLLSGSPPFNGDTEMKVLLAHQNDTPRPLCEVNREVPRELSDLVDRMLAKNPDDRPQTPKEVAEALLPFAKGEFTPPAEQPADPFAFLQDRAPAIADDTPVPTATILLPEAKPRRGIWTRAVIAASMFLALAMGAWALGVFTLRTPAGTIIVENLPGDVDVQVDGNQATFTHGDDAVSITAVEQGEHHLKFLRDGKEIWTSDAKIDFGGHEVHVAYEEHDPARAAQNFGGAWWIRDGKELVQDSYAYERTAVAFGDIVWTDYNFELEVRYDRASQAATKPRLETVGVAFAVGGLNHYRFLQLGTDREKNAALGYSLDNARSPLTQWKPQKFESDRWHKVKIEVRGDWCRCWLDGEKLFEGKDPRCGNGCVGLGTVAATVRFRNIVVTTPDGKKNLWEGMPTGLLRTGPSMAGGPQAAKLRSTPRGTTRRRDCPSCPANSCRHQQGPARRNQPTFLTRSSSTDLPKARPGRNSVFPPRIVPAAIGRATHLSYCSPARTRMHALRSAIRSGRTTTSRSKPKSSPVPMICEHYSMCSTTRTIACSNWVPTGTPVGCSSTLKTERFTGEGTARAP